MYSNIVYWLFVSTLAPDFSTVQREVSKLIKDRILIGHSVHYDLKVHSFFLTVTHKWSNDYSVT